MQKVYQRQPNCHSGQANDEPLKIPRRILSKQSVPYSISNSIGQWSEPNISVWIEALVMRSRKRSEVRK